MPSDDAIELIAGHATENLIVSAAPPPPVSPALARSAAMVSAGILLSRLFGLIRQRLFAHYFGVSLFADAIMAAFQIGNVTQNLLGEGPPRLRDTSDGYPPGYYAAFVLDPDGNIEAVCRER